MPAAIMSMLSRSYLLATSCATLLAASCGDSPSGEGESSTGDTEANAPTWHQDVAPIVSRSCSSCHVTNGIAPFDLSTYENAKTLAPVLAQAATAGTMPPFFAQETDQCQPPHGWQDDIRLSDAEKTLIQAWSDAGAPEGDPATAAELPAAPDLTLPGAQTHLTIPKAITVEGTSDRFSCFSVDAGVTTPSFLTGTQIRPGNARIVHHVLVYLDEEGKSADLAGDDGEYECFGGSGVEGAALLAAWAPGAVPSITPPGVGMYVPAHSRLIINVHYHPTGLGAETDDSTTLDIQWGDLSSIQYAASLALVGNFNAQLQNGEGLLPGPNDSGPPEFRIPAGARNHTEDMIFSIPDEGVPEYLVWAVGTHMHYVGTDMRFDLQRADGSSTCLVQTPNWDFNWQRGYAYDAPLDQVPRARPGDVLGMHCTYDNSLENPFVREALAQQGLTEPHDVWLGEETLDEMCLGVLGVAFPLGSAREMHPQWGRWRSVSAP